MRNAAAESEVRSIRRLGLAVLLLAGAVLAAAQQPLQTQETGQQQSSSSPASKASATADPGSSRPWSNSSPNPSPLAGPAARNSNPNPANAARQKQLAADSAELLKLANELKTEVDKTNKDTLSLTVIRKAGEIEKLAHNVKEKMRLTASPN